MLCLVCDTFSSGFFSSLALSSLALSPALSAVFSAGFSAGFSSGFCALHRTAVNISKIPAIINKAGRRIEFVL